MKTYEADEQAALIEWTKYAVLKYPELHLLYHIPNGGSRNKAEAVNLKRQGVKAGVPDLCLPAPKGGFHGMYIEMKSATGKLRDTQKVWLSRLDNQGYYVVVCYSWESAKAEILRYLKGETYAR